MKNSIVIDMQFAQYDMIDGKPNVERHHIFGGADRDKSDEDGLWIPLSKEHHTGKMSVHMNKEMRVLSHIIGQLAWELHYVITHPGADEEDAKCAFFDRYKKNFV